MGRLLGLELNNFKSYRGRSTIGFGTSHFTSIIGPNGSGKSNMMDAISFVLGVQSSQLRSNQLKDLIYRGKRETTDADDTDFVDEHADPTRAHVLAVYEKDNGEILNLKRTISSNGSSEYRINDVSVTALNYSIVLKGENILLKARNFLVFQGDVEQIASQSPKDLTKLIENISRSSEFIPEYDQLAQELEKAHEFTVSVFSRKKTLAVESKQYKEQRDEQIEFQNKIIQKSDQLKKIKLYKLYHNEKIHDNLIGDSKKHRNEVKNLKSALQNNEKIFKKSQSDYSKLVLESKKLEKDTKVVSTEINDLNRQLVPIDASKRAKSTKISSLKQLVTTLTQDIKRQKLNQTSVEKKLRDAQKLYDQFQVKADSSSVTSISDEGQAEYEELRLSYLSSEGSELDAKLSLLVNEKDSIQDVIDNLRNQKSNAQSRIEELENILNSDLTLKADEISLKVTETLALKREKTEARSKLIKLKEEHNFKEIQLNSQLREILTKLDELASQQRESEKQKRLRENVALLKKLLPNGSIKGLVSDLVRPSKQKYDLALLTILGMNFDSIIIESSAIAYKCIEILKERRLGTATFIPLDSVVIDPINLNYLRSLDIGAQPGIDIVEYDDKTIEQAIQYVIGDAIVTENIDLAKRLKWSNNNQLKSKIVTVEGSVIHKSGLMTGGLQQQKHGAVLNWDKNELKNLNEIKEDLYTQLSKLHESKPRELEISQIEDEITEIDDILPTLRSQKINIERVIGDRQSEISFQKELVSTYDESIIKNDAKKRNFVDQIHGVQKEIRVLQNKIYGDFCEKYSFFNGIEDYENLHGSTLRERSKEKMGFSKSVVILTNKLNFENERLKDIEERKVTLEGQLSKAESEMVDIVSERQALTSRIDKLDAEYEVLVSEKDQYANQLQSKLKSTRALEATFKEVENQMLDINKTIADIEEKLLSVDTERVTYLRNCKIEGVNIPLIDGLLDSVPITGNFESLVKEIYNIEIDYSDLDERLKENFNIKTEAALEVELQNIIEQLEKLTPNAKAVERLNEIQERITEYENEVSAARQKERKLNDKFHEIKAKRFDRFMEAFKHISEKIDSIYKELTTSPTSPVGGSAYLNVEDSEEPYNFGIKYHAMPPMKRFRDMELLSGGEKTMAALALLFAIHTYQPSPFFVLDEVDAALDNANVARIANYIKKSAGPNFQFIVISLKNSFYEKSDALVGIYREQRANSSKTVTLDLREYPEEEVAESTEVGA